MFQEVSGSVCVVSDFFKWFQLVSRGFNWFQVAPCFCKYSLYNDKKQHVSLLRNGDLYLLFIFEIEFDLQSINQEFQDFLRLLRKHSFQYFPLEL